jgi:hypothetical protein
VSSVWERKTPLVVRKKFFLRYSVSGSLGTSHEVGGEVFVVGGVELEQRRGVSGVRYHVFSAVYLTMLHC